MYRSETHNSADSMSRNSPDLLKLLTDDVTAGYQSPTLGSQRKVMLFKMIRGGNVAIVEKVLRTLKEAKRIHELNWILGLDKHSVSFANRTYPKCINFAIKTFNYTIIYFFAFLFVVLTPIFYIIHSATHAVVTSRRRNLMDSIDLPLIYAVLSENEDMMGLFASFGVKLTITDSQCNNIFHYLADLSSTNPEKAIRCFDMVNGLVQPNVIKEAIFEAQNDQGLTSVELLVAHGSFTYLTHMTEVEGVMKRTVLDVSPDHIHVSSPSAIGDCSIETSPMPMDRCLGKYTLCAFDVSTYEQGDVLCKQSLLLSLVSSRDFSKVSQEEVECFFKCRWITKWCYIKILSSTLKGRIYTVLMLITFVLYVLFMKQNSLQIPPLSLRKDYLSYMHSYLIQQLKSDYLRPVDEEVLLVYESSINNYFAGSPTDNDTKLANEAYQMICAGNTTQVNGELALDTCIYEGLLHASKSCSTFNQNPEALMIKTGLVEVPKETYQIIITSLLVVSLLLQVLSDVLLRLFFVYQQRSSFQHGTKRGLIVLFSQRLPWSYFQAQLTILNVFIITTFIYINCGYAPESLNLNYESLVNRQNIESFLLVATMMVTTIQMIYAVRLAPIVGLFIRTSKKLMWHILEFAITYAWVSGAFAVIFYTLLHNPECAAEKMEGYETLLKTFYKTYLATLGQGDFPATFSTGVCITFAAYSVVSVIMLLNLIIAVMSATADTIMNPPWKDVLQLTEDLKWALYLEAFGFMVCRPFRKILGPTCCLGFKSPSNEMVIRMEKGRRKVYVEVETDL